MRKFFTIIMFLVFLGGAAIALYGVYQTVSEPEIQVEEHALNIVELVGSEKIEAISVDPDGALMLQGASSAASEQEFSIVEEDSEKGDRKKRVLSFSKSKRAAIELPDIPAGDAELVDVPEADGEAGFQVLVFGNPDDQPIKVEDAPAEDAVVPAPAPAAPMTQLRLQDPDKSIDVLANEIAAIRVQLKETQNRQKLDNELLNRLLTELSGSKRESNGTKTTLLGLIVAVFGSIPPWLSMLARGRVTAA